VKWTTSLPTRTGWYWLRHVVGSIPYDEPVHCVLMRQAVKRRGKWVYNYDGRPSVYWNGRWRDLSAVPTGIRWFWSDRPIRLPHGISQKKAAVFGGAS
jgi:hypothetical protein